MITIRKANFADFEKIVNVEMECFRDYYPPEMIAELFLEDSVLVVAEENDDIIGYGAVVFYHSYAEIVSLGVIPSRRGKGIGTMILRELEKYVAERNTCNYLQIHVRADNINAIQLYVGEGYEIVMLVENYYENNIDGSPDAYLMRKKIANA